MENAYNTDSKFDTKAIKHWNGHDWQGFFQYLEHEIEGVYWNYAFNLNGGFWFAVMGWFHWGKYPTYIQLEEGKLCFMVSIDPEVVVLSNDTSRADVRNQLHELIMTRAGEHGLHHVRRPERFGYWNYNTVAIVDREYWLGKDSEHLNKENVVKILKDYLTFLEKYSRSYQVHSLDTLD